MFSAGEENLKIHLKYPLTLSHETHNNFVCHILFFLSMFWLNIFKDIPEQFLQCPINQYFKTSGLRYYLHYQLLLRVDMSMDVMY